MSARVAHAVVLPYWLGRPASEGLEIARTADHFGYPELWIGEMATFDAFALGGAIARETTRIALTLGPLALGVRSPVALALGAGSVSELGGRPARLALGASSPAIVGGWHGREYARLPERASETIAALRPLLRGERSAARPMRDARALHDESPTRIEATVRPPLGSADSASLRASLAGGFKLRVAAPSPELTLAAFGPKMLGVAAREADRALLNLVTPAAVRETRGVLDREARAAGRASPRLAIWLSAALEPSADALAQLARQVCVYLAPPGYGEMFRAAGFGALVDRARSGEPQAKLANEVPRALLDAVAALGDVQQLRARLRDYRDAGADEIAIVPVTAGDDAGRRVLEALRG
jgi:alkanesulfonate monooxygenase SsuD/methylene tetrahydromethanopterin reductase-like flavin-dependent oxidoreductase (luciferase family)